MKYVEIPLTREEIEARLEDGRLRVVVAVELSDLLNCDGIEGFNDLVEGKIGNELLSDINYKLAGVSGDSILFEVDAEVEFI